MEIELIGTLYSDTVSISVEKVTNCGANDCPMVDEPHIIFRVITLITIRRQRIPASRHTALHITRSKNTK